MYHVFVERGVLQFIAKKKTHISPHHIFPNLPGSHLEGLKCCGGLWSWSCVLRPHMSVAYTCSHYSPTNLRRRGSGSAPGACVVFLLLPWRLFIHLHSRPRGDCEPLGFHPTTLKVRWAARGRQEVNNESSSLFFVFLPIFSFSRSLSICIFLSHTVSPLHCSFHF